MVKSSRFGQIVAVVALCLSMCVKAQGQAFSAPKNISSNSHSSVIPQTAVDPAGNINVVWEDDISTTSSNILFSCSHDGGATFLAPVNISRSSGLSTNPHIAVDSQGHINVAWVNNAAGKEIFFSRSIDGGVNFSSPQNLSQDAASSTNPQIAVDASGNINVVWENDDFNFGVLYSHSTDGGVNFSVPRSLASNAEGSFGPQLAIAADGSINVVWEDDFNFQSDISFSRSTDNGATFSTPKNVSNNPGTSFGAQIAVDPSGVVNVAWVDNTAGAYDIYFSRSTDQGANFSSIKNLSNNANDSSNPQLGVDTKGGVYVTWEHNMPPTFMKDIFFARSSDGGANFAAPVNFTVNGGDSRNPSITVDAGGAVNLSWQDTTPGRGNIFFARSVDAGATFATQNLSNDSGSSTNPQVAADKNGNLNVVWSDDMPGVKQILFSRLSTPQTTNHPPVANAGPDQTVECAGHGGSLVTLNGSASSDPDGDALSYLWTDEVNNLVGTAAIAQISVSMGTHTFTLTVTDPAGVTSAAVTHVTVQDTVAPTLSVSLSASAWSHHHRFVLVTATVAMSDACDASPTVQLVSVTSNDRDYRNDVRAVGGGPVAFGTDVRSFLVRAEHEEWGAPLVYTATYAAKDASGHTTLATAQLRFGGFSDVRKKHRKNEKHEDEAKDGDRR